MTDQERQELADKIAEVLKTVPWNEWDDVMRLVKKQVCLQCGSKEGSRCVCWWDD